MVSFSPRTQVDAQLQDFRQTLTNLSHVEVAHSEDEVTLPHIAPSTSTVDSPTVLSEEARSVGWYGME